MFGRGKKTQLAAKEAERSRKISESQNALLTAAVATADAAQEVTTLLKSKLDEIIDQFNHTARILSDGLIICDAAGDITYFNPAAEVLFGIGYKDALGTPVLRFFTGSERPLANTGELWVRFQNEDTNDVKGVPVVGKPFCAHVSFSVLERQGGTNAILLLVRDADRCTSAPCVEASRYAAIFETAFDAIVVVKNGLIAAANPSVSRLFGHGLNVLMGLPISALVIDREKDHFLACLTDINDESSRNFLVEGLHESGRVLTLMFTVTEVEWEGGTAVLTTIRDITEMKRLEKIVAMKRDNGVDMICAFDPAYRITFVNQTFAIKHATTISALLGTDVRDLADNALEFQHVIEALGVDVPAIRSHVQVGDEFQDWIDHGIYDDGGKIVEYQRVGRLITRSLTDAIKKTG